MRRLLPFLVIYVLIQPGNQKRTYEGMDPQTVQALVEEQIANNQPGSTYKFVDEKTYNAIPDIEKQPDALKPAEVQQNIVDAKDATKTTDQRLNSLIKAVGY